MARRVTAFILAFVTTYVLATVAIAQANLGYLSGLGRDIGFAERLGYIGHDVVGMAGMFAPIVLVTLLVAYAVVALIASRAPALRLAGYVIGGFTGMVAVYLVLQAVFGMNAVWATASAFGLTVQGLAGAVGGYVFARVNPRSAA